MEFTEKTIKSQEIYKGKIITVKKDDIELPTGDFAIREVVEHADGVAVLAQKENGNVILVKQFRYPIKDTILEIPAGKLEKDENPDDAIKRELEEETGYISDEWIKLGYMYTSIGFCNEKIYLYLAKNVTYKKQNPDEDEIIEYKEYPLSELYKLTDNGTISDSKALCALQRARKYLDYD